MCLIVEVTQHESPKNFLVMSTTGSFFNGFTTYVSSKAAQESYKMGDILGQGGFGQVVKATCLSTGQQVAIKTMSKKGMYTAYARHIIEAEVSVLRKLKHEHILQIHEALHDEDNVYIVTELCEGGDLFDNYLEKIREVSIKEVRVLHHMKQVLEAVAFLHRNGIAHRDIKGENIVLAGDKAKLIDFGFALAQGLDGRELSTDFVGTPRYMSPEMKQRLPHCPQSADMWACGAVLYEMLIGMQFPGCGSSESDDFASDAYSDGEDEYATTMDLDWSRDTFDLLAVMLEVDPSKRISAESALAIVNCAIENLTHKY